MEAEAVPQMAAEMAADGGGDGGGDGGDGGDSSSAATIRGSRHNIRGVRPPQSR